MLEVDFPDPKQPLRAKLTCASCHQPDAGGANMRPVSMEQHCSYCHSLSFDKENPDRVLPHGKPEEVVDVLTYFYGARGVRPPLTRTDKTKQRRRPGAKAEPAVAPAPAPRRAPRRPSPTRPSPSGSSACSPTTAIDLRLLPPDHGDADRQGPRLRHPARAGAGASGSPSRAFIHAPHANLPCAHCHAADTSSISSDVLLPPIADCRDCHLGEAAAAAVPSTCTMCHVYHQKQDTCPMVPGAGVVATAGGAVCPTAHAS